jgi:hypothetical protein
MREQLRNQIKRSWEKGKINRLQDIADIATKTALAKIIGKSGTSFDQLMNSPEEITLGDWVKIARYGKIPEMDILNVAKKECAYKIIEPESRHKKYGMVNEMIEAGEITTLDMILGAIPIYILAADMHVNRQRLGKLKKKVDNFKLKHLILIGSLLKLDKNKIFTLITNTYEKQHSNKLKQVLNIKP